jgi:hypothetical protein
MRRFFEAPTITALAEAIERNGETVQTDGLAIGRRSSRFRAADLLSRVEELSDEEVDRLLNDPDLKTIGP